MIADIHIKKIIVKYSLIFFESTKCLKGKTIAINLSIDICISVIDDAPKDTTEIPIRDIQKFMFVDSSGTSSSTRYITNGTTMAKSATDKFAETIHIIHTTIFTFLLYFRKALE